MVLNKFKITNLKTNYRKNAKKIIEEYSRIEHFHPKILLYIIPFLFGFSKMVALRYQNESISVFLNKNLPGLLTRTEQVNWETFKGKSVDHQDIKRINIYNDYVIIEKKENKSLNYGIIEISQQEKLDLKAKWSSICFVDKNIDCLATTCYTELIEKPEILNNLFYNMDEFPSKLRRNFIEKKKKVNSINCLNILHKTTTFPTLNCEKSENIPITTDFFGINRKNRDEKTVFGKQQTLSRNQIKTKISEKFLTQNISEKNYFKKYILLERVLDSIFHESELDPLYIEKVFFNKNSLFAKELLNNTSDNFIKKIETNRKANINYFLKKQKTIKNSPDFALRVLNSNTKKKFLNNIFPPTMSGYLYPDMNLKKVKEFQFNSVIHRFSNNPIPIKINLTDNPIVFINSILEQTAISSSSIQKTPLLKNKNIFFGTNFPTKKLNIQSSSKLELLNQTLIKKDPFKINLVDQDPNGWFFVFNKEINENTQFSSDYDSFSNLFFLLDKQNSRNQTWSENINIKFLPIAETSVQENLSNPQKIEILYKRIPYFKVLESNWNSFLFYNLWEPITQDSWLITAQLLSGALIFRIVKDLYQEYGKEMLSYVFQFAASLGIDIDELKDQYLSNDKEKGYRIISRVKKGFNDIAGIDGILPQIGEIVWFLRNSGRSIKLTNTIPKGILLVGPPGTGKTLLVQAIAGEAQVPILVESGSLLSDPQKRGQAVQRLKTIFTKARDLAPCIIFIDEVDTLGEKRQQLIQNPMGEDQIVESIYENKRKVSTSEFILKPKNLLEETTKGEDIEYEIFRESSDSQSNKEFQELQQSLEAKKSRRSLLMQFLVELDGLQSRNGVLVIGATNRPSVLDPALIRPGRFDLVISLELPSKQKRIQILKLYSEKLNFDKKISWDYLSDRTIGFSAADLAAIMNESSIQAILNETTHTIETIEKGIDLVTSYNSEKVKITDLKKLKNNFSITRLGFYQAGKGVLHTILKNHPSSVVLYLWPRQKNARHTNNVFSFAQNPTFNITTKLNLETQLVGLYAGKASEILSLFGTSQYNNVQVTLSNLGLEDISSASLLANAMIEKWYFYSKEILINREQTIEESKNEHEFTEAENLQILSTINKSLETELEFEKLAKIARSNRYQHWSFQPWWQIQITKQISDLDSSYADWYRIYLPNPEESTLNIEWVLPDTYYHANIALKSLSSNNNVSINNLYKIKKDYIYHGLILNSFNKAFSLLDENREFLDYFTDYLLRYEIIRQDTLHRILVSEKFQDNKNYKKNQKRKIEKKWGSKSRRKFSRFIDFKKLI